MTGKTTSHETQIGSQEGRALLGVIAATTRLVLTTPIFGEALPVRPAASSWGYSYGRYCSGDALQGAATASAAQATLQEYYSREGFIPVGSPYSHEQCRRAQGVVTSSATCQQCQR
jgi:hypothetical protein